MNAFYLLVILTIIALASLLAGLAPTSGKAPRRLPIERRRPVLTPLQAKAMITLEQALGNTRRVQPLLPLRALLTPAGRVSARQAERWRAQLATLSADLAILSANGTQALCVVLITAGGKPPRRVRLEQQRIKNLCKQAGLPVATLSGEESLAPDALKARIEELIWPLEASLQKDHPVASEDEDALLAGLAAAARDRSVTHRRRGG